MKKYLFIFAPLIAAALCSLLLFTSLDNKVYNLFLESLPSLKEDDSVLIITVDDAAIENVGLFPWTRDILADAIVFLREMGARTVAFDLSYLDPSPVRIDPAYVQEELPAYLDDGFRRINDTVAQVMDGFSSGVLRAADAQDMKQQVQDFNNSVRGELGVSVDYVMRDVDAYFARTLKFFGNSYLTLTMVPRENVLTDEPLDLNAHNRDWLESHIALKNIDGTNDTLTPQSVGIIPAIFKLVSQARGAGFVNADPDSDGYRRRVPLVLKHNGQYYAHLTLAAMRESLGNPDIEVDNSHITLKNARTGGGTADIRIPRSRDGSVLIKWPKKSFYDYNILSSWELIRYTRLEAIFAKNLAAMNESGFFSYWDGGETPLEKYNNANYLRGLLEEENTGENINFDTFLDYRRDYLEAAKAFLAGPYEENILGAVGDDTQVRAFVTELFTAARKQYDELVSIREQVSAKVKDVFAVIGVAATSMTDEGLIAFEERYPNVGTYAVIANMILSGEFLDDAPRLVSLCLALVLSLGLALIVRRLEDMGKSVLIGLCALFVTAAGLWAYFMATRQYVGAVAPFASVALTFFILTAFNFLSTVRDKSVLRSAFSRYVAPEVVNEIIADPSKLNLGGEKREMTAIFTDIQGFSTISEKLDPVDLVNLLNLYLTTMSNLVMENRGTIDKYEGDAIIAFFGAPARVEEHAAMACRTAVQMKKAEASLNVRIAEEKLSPTALFTRIGINTGDMVVGNMGTPNKMDYTIMGNAVNLAARLEGVNKQYNTGGILISEYTRKQIGDGFVLRSLDRVRVVGINTPLRLYELLDIKADAPQALFERCEKWEKAVGLYESFDFEAAAALFRSLTEENENDGTAKLCLGRCEAYMRKPPPPDWDGVYNLTQK
ncbi:MAG: CHASE2 domain-containing protein [Spirochaetales bacterium]|jgi:adenylate cyclase|nr:CHASE2 domain-containing protein [Spirochaetales bacterium]